MPGTIDAVLQYASLLDVSDPYSELTPPHSEIVPVAAAAFPQRPGGLNAILGHANGELPQRLDAFQLRVQAPAEAQNAPVVVFIPGGGFMTGTGHARWFNAAELVEREHVVLVTMNYRIGALGHFGPAGDADESQRGLRDLVTALEWVRLHIAAFGGNRDDITLAGDSAGAWYAFALATLERTRGLFSKLVLLSLPWEPPLDTTAYGNRRSTLLAALEHPLEGSRTDEVLAAQGELARAFAGRGMVAMPAAGGEIPANLHDFETSVDRLHVDSFLLLSTTEEFAAFVFPAPDAAFTDEQVDGLIAAKFEDPATVGAWTARKWSANNEVDIASEGTLTPKQRMIEAMTLHQFELAQLRLAAAAVARGITVGVASFALQSNLPGAHSPHCFPLPFLFNRQWQVEDGIAIDTDWADAPMLRELNAEAAIRVTEDLQRWFFDYAKSSVSNPFDPNHPTRTVFSAAGAALKPPLERALLPRY
ncbi:MAG: carboxylesterase family protein [Gulosibacter sp.]|uniref:carboxylesterase family protein n=1 Tax=Gulosibacter sp. TaxID=2817531 RepID=UPI003F9079AC